MLQHLRTLRHLRCRQIAAQLRNRISTVFENPVSGSNIKAPGYPGCKWHSPLPSPPPNGSSALQPEAASGKFSFLNRTESPGFPPRWNNPDLPALWQYNLHYLDWIHGLDYEKSRECVVSWIRQHLPERGNIGWEPYPVSLRLINWTFRFFGRDKRRTEGDSEFVSELWRSLFLQAEWLQNHLEYHLMANHLFENGAALALAGSCFEGPEAGRWFETGFGILKEEIKEQVLPDGTHFERSPTYHSRILYVLLLLASTGNPRLRRLVDEPILRMIPALKRLTHPDGKIALLNDSAFGIYAEPRKLFDYAAQLFPEAAERSADETGFIELGNAGCYGWRSPEGHYLICNAGSISPDYQPGHSHADIFSFELSLHGQRLIVDSGVSEYRPGPRRDYCRATRAHNTVEIAGKDQSEMWAAFRVARRARLFDLLWEPGERGFVLQATHDGYSRIRHGLNHCRRIEWSMDGLLRITDRVDHLKEGEAVSRLHLHPECRVEEAGRNAFVIMRNAVRANVNFSNSGHATIADGEYYPEFGKVVPNKVLEFFPEAGVSEWEVVVEAIE